MTGTAYQSMVDKEKKAGKYPSRVEGYSATGTPLYRAVFAPVVGSAWQSNHGRDCPTYQSTAATLAGEGYESASLQSFVSADGTRRYQANWVKWQGASARQRLQERLRRGPGALPCAADEMDEAIADVLHRAFCENRPLRGGDATSSVPLGAKGAPHALDLSHGGAR
jgi:hypothetical protein